MNCGMTSILLPHFQWNIFIVAFSQLFPFWLLGFILALLLLAKYDRESLFDVMMSEDHKLKIKTSKH